MSTTAVCLPTLRCSCSARRSVRNPKTSKTRKFPKSPTPKTEQRLLYNRERAPSIPLGNPYNGSGGEATSYTRLPLKGDFSSSSDGPSATEIKLSDLAAPAASSTEDVYDDENAAGISGLENYEDREGEDVEYADEDDGDEEFWEFEDGELVAEEGKALSFADEGEDFAMEEEDEEEEGEKGRGVPAVMRCFDTAKVYVRAGDGGNVYIEVDGAVNSLLPFRKCVHFRAGKGGHGQGRKQAGAKGEDVVVKVAPGTVIREAGHGGSKGDVLLELIHPGQKALLLPGGRGGRGNASFKSGVNKVPKIAERGEEGAEMWLDLELKLVADVGIVGAPNAGKSTLLSAISAAEPTIANYPFTTLLPNLGVVSLDFDATMVVADLPGLLEGAHRGFGLGHKFLRHTERCSILVHVVDGSGMQPEYEFDAIRLELELFSPSLAGKPYLVAFNKMDLPEAYEKWESFQTHLLSRGITVFNISAANRQGTHEVISAAYDLLRKERDAEKNAEDWLEESNLNHVAETIQKQRSAAMSEFEIIHDAKFATWHVFGAGIQRFVQMTNWQYTESLRRFQHALEACGVNKALIKEGVKEGDTVNVAGMEMIWHDSPDKFGPSSTKKGFANSARWSR